MQTLKAHFDGKAIVLDEPASLTAGQAVTVVVTNDPPKVKTVSFDELTVTFVEREEWDERSVLAKKTVPSDFVRKPGSAAGQIWIADDFDETPEEFKEYL